MLTYLTQCQNIGRMEKQADTNLHIQGNVYERQCGHLSHCHWASLGVGKGWTVSRHVTRHYEHKRHCQCFETFDL